MTVSYLLDLESEDYEETEELCFKAMEDIETTKMLQVNGKKIERKWNSTRSLMLDPESMNCGICPKCGSWTTDREKENSISGLGNGATVDGILLCDECLPSEHPWAF